MRAVGVTHRVDGVLSFFYGRRNWDFHPHPHTQTSVCTPPPLWFRGGGGAHLLEREGVGESQFERWDRYCGTLGIQYMSMYFWSSIFLLWPPPYYPADSLYNDDVTAYIFYVRSQKMYSMCVCRTERSPAIAVDRQVGTKIFIFKYLRKNFAENIPRITNWK